MIPLLDTVIGFATVMLMLSLLVKCLTSLLKNQMDFYTKNLQHEVDRLVKGILGVGWKQAVARLPAGPDKCWLEEINWERLGEEILTKPHMEWVLVKLGAPPAALTNLEGQLVVHVANLQYAFETRMKNLALAVGLALCLGLNINGLTIWKTLYSDQQLRTTFATTYAKSALASAEAAQGTTNPPANAAPAADPAQSGNSSAVPQTDASSPTSAPNAKTDPDEAQRVKNTANAKAQRERLDADTQAFMKQLVDFQKDVSFGIGQIWSADPSKVSTAAAWKFFASQFLGSLMTAVLISIGAAYWHDLLQTLSSFSKQG
jgi:hypothetical protein